MQTYVIPVDSDYDRFIAPLICNQLDVDRVILLKGAARSEASVEYSRNLSGELEKDFESLLDAEAEHATIDDVYDCGAAFKQAHDLVSTELDADDKLRDDDDEPDEVWVSVSTMPRPVFFAFATAAHSIMVEQRADREYIRTYYTAPEKYFETKPAEELQIEHALLQNSLDSGEIDANRIRERLDVTSDLLSGFDERGTTTGVKQVDSRHIVELSMTSFSSVKPFEEIILFKLGERDEFGSVSELAKALVRETNKEYTDPFRSKIVYDVDRPGPGGKGYIEQEKRGGSYRVHLSRIGEPWVHAHADSDE